MQNDNMTPDFAAQVAAALDARKAAQAAGPRTEADLARALGVSRVDLHRRLAGDRPMPPEMAARIRAILPEINRPGVPFYPVGHSSTWGTRGPLVDPDGVVFFIDPPGTKRVVGHVIDPSDCGVTWGAPAAQSAQALLGVSPAALIGRRVEALVSFPADGIPVGDIGAIDAVGESAYGPEIHVKFDIGCERRYVVLPLAAIGSEIRLMPEHAK